MSKVRDPNQVSNNLETTLRCPHRSLEVWTELRISSPLRLVWKVTLQPSRLRIFFRLTKSYQRVWWEPSQLSRDF
jgi:hypothetical protein